MVKKYNLEDLKEFSYNPFLNYKSKKIFDQTFIGSLSKSEKDIIKYLIYKHTFTAEKFFFNVAEFNRLMKYMNMDLPSQGIAALCAKEVLAKTKEVNVYWVNNKLFNTRFFQPKYMGCMAEDIPT